MILRGCWCDTVLSVHAPIGDRNEGTKESFYKELQLIFSQFPKYHIKILLGDFNEKVERKDIFIPTTSSESLHETSNDNGVRVVNFTTSKKCNCTRTQCFHITAFINALCLMVGTYTVRLITF
jgi:hypothetical protein